MTTAHVYPSDVAFSPSVKAIQEKKGSRHAYARVEKGGGWQTELSPDVIPFIEAQNTAYIASVNAEGQPYIQHRGGPPGFLKVLDPHTIAFADFAGNRQYVTLGNLADNPKVCVFLMDYTEQQRVKIWGEARVVEDDPALVERLMPRDYKAKAERAIVITVTTWDVNCRQHIPQKFDAPDVERTLSAMKARIDALEAENRKLLALTKT
jgi:predicted pyridoxine 5'-phosphate oxidase superfamily flavin-nucleotide-binding protein